MKPKHFNQLFTAAARFTVLSLGADLSRGVVTNSAETKGQSYAITANVSALTGGEWELIAPYGDFPTADRKKIQRFTRKEAKAMVATFNSLWHKLGTGFRGVPIFHGHPDVDPKSWPDDRRLGKVIAIEDREDGLYGKPEYNALGKENKAEGWWVYPSPAWLFPRTAANVINPDELLSIGLVNTPNIPGSAPWANSTDPDADPESPTDTDEIMKTQLIALLGLAANAADADIIAAVTTAKTDAAAKAKAEVDLVTANSAKTTAETELATERGKVTTANAETERVRKIAAETIAANAVTTGRLTEADRQTTINSLIAPGADLAVLGKAVLEKAPVMNTGHLDLGGKKIAISNARERQAAITAEVNSRIVPGRVDYDAAYQSVKNDPQFKPLFDAMKQPGQESAE